MIILGNDLMGNDDSKFTEGIPASHSPDFQDDIWTAEPCLLHY